MLYIFAEPGRDFWFVETFQNQAVGRSDTFTYLPHHYCVLIGMPGRALYIKLLIPDVLTATACSYLIHHDVWANLGCFIAGIFWHGEYNNRPVLSLMNGYHGKQTMVYFTADWTIMTYDFHFSCVEMSMLAALTTLSKRRVSTWL